MINEDHLGMIVVVFEFLCIFIAKKCYQVIIIMCIRYQHFEFLYIPFRLQDLPDPIVCDILSLYYDG